MLTRHEIWIYGDFNIHVDIEDDSGAVHFSTTLDAFRLEQHVCNLMHIGSHTLDLVISRDGTKPKQLHLVQGVSDHLGVFSLLSCAKQARNPVSSKMKTRRNWKIIPKNLVRTDLFHSLCCLYH
jgi:hypothetical protein